MILQKIPPFLLAAVFLLVNSGCKTQPLSGPSGKITLSAGWKPVVYLIQPRQFLEIASNYGGIVIDSAAVGVDGRFSFPALPEQVKAGLFELCVQPVGSRYANQLLDDNPLLSNYMPIILEPGVPTYITAEAARFQASFSFDQPSEDNNALLRLRDIRHASFQQHMAGHTEAPDENNLLEHEAAVLHFREPLMAFADSTRQFLPALTAIRWVSPEADYERVPEFMAMQCLKWTTETHDDPRAQQLCQTARFDKLPLLVGQQMPDFSMPMVSGDTSALYTLLGRQLTVVDIWASWCAPCRRENREVLAPLYKEFRENGLQIIGYSIDSSPEAWKNAIAKDSAVWPHASHLTGDETPFMQALRIKTIPANFVLDGKGKVIGKNLHGDRLRDLVREYVK